MDITVDLLIELDKLIQILESPVFIRNFIKIKMIYFWILVLDTMNYFFRLENGAFGWISESIFNSITLWTSNDNASIKFI